MSGIERLLRDIVDRLRQESGVGVLTRTDDTKSVQSAQFESGGAVYDQAKHYQTYGISIRPKTGAGVVWRFIGLLSGHLQVLAYPDGRYRKKELQEGEVCLYTDEGDYIILSRGRIVKVVAGAEIDVQAPVVKVIASTSITLDSPTLEVTGDLTVGGNLDVSGSASIEGAGGLIVSHGNVTVSLGQVLVTVGPIKVGGIPLNVP